MGTSHLVLVRHMWDHSHEVQVRPRYIREYPGPNDAQVRNRVNRSRRGPNMDQSHCVLGEARRRPQKPGQESAIWEPEPPDLGEVQVGPQSQGPGEAQVATGFTKSRGGPGGDLSPDPGVDQLRTRFTRPK